MQIEKLEIRSFSKLKNLNLNFSKGINIIYGSNESGKTSVQTFIKAMLYGLKGGRAAKDGSLPPLKKYKPWEGTDYSGYIEFKLDEGDSFRVERDFNSNSVKIYDSSFNDITGSFDMTKDRGPLFAEKYLGLNDTCFEKTVFIRQLESKIDEEAGRELLSRLLNVSQTGFEDISLTRAQEALKEAQKTFIGTDKTSTRPLDRIVARLEELRALRSQNIEKRNDSFRIENSLLEENAVKICLEERKTILLIAKGLLQQKKEIDSIAEKKSELEQLLSNIQNTEQERNTILKRILEINAVKKQLERFSSYSEEDLDGINVAYHSMVNLENENKRLQQESSKKSQNSDVFKKRLQELDAFAGLEENSEGRVLNLVKELEHLRIEKEKNNIDVLEEKIKASRSRDTFAAVKLAFAAILMLCAGFAWFLSPSVSYMAMPVFLILLVTSIVAKSKSTKELEDLLNIKKVAFVFSSGILEEIDKKQKLLDDIINKTGVDGVEEFFKLKAEYDSVDKSFRGLEEEIKSLEEEIQSNKRRLGEIKDSLTHMFIEAGVIKESDEIKEVHVSEFKNSVRRYCGLQPSVKYVMQRVEDLEGILVVSYTKASNLCGNECRTSEDVKEYIDSLTDRMKALEEGFNSDLQHFEKECAEKKVSITGLENLSNRFNKLQINELEDIISLNYNNCCEELNSIMLRIKEYETLLRSMDISDDAIQSIDREIEELELKKNELGDLSICLKIATDLLTEAGNEIQKDFAPILNQKMSKIISRITSERYKDLRADDRLYLKAVTGDSGDVVTAAALSGGTVDQIYLSLRLAMADMISSGGESLPVIMDEIFAQYDDTRTKETMKYFKEISDTRQLILFTCKSREIGLAREVLGDSANIIELSM